MEKLEVIQLQTGFRAKWIVGNDLFVYDHEVYADLRQLTHRMYTQRDYEQATFNNAMIDRYYPGMEAFLTQLIEEVSRTQQDIAQIREQLKDYNRKMSRLNKRIQKAERFRLEHEQHQKQAQLKEHLQRQKQQVERFQQEHTSVLPQVNPTLTVEPLVPYRVEFALGDETQEHISCVQCEAVCIKPSSLSTDRYKVLCPLCYRKQLKITRRGKAKIKVQ